MQLVTFLQPLLVPFLFSLSRVAGIFLFTPLLTSVAVPRTFMALFAFTLTLAIFPSVPQATFLAAPPADLGSLAFIMFSELLIGVTIGLIAMLPIFAMQMGGFLMGYQMGLGLAQAFNPEMEGSSDVISQMMFILGITVYVAAGGIDLVFLSLLTTFDRIPIGAFAIDHIPIELFLHLLSSGFELAIRLAAPVMGAIMLSLISMGFVMKTMPQINILSVGFAAKIMSGIAIMAIALGTIDSVLRDETMAALNELLIWADSLRPL
jgi:flagellar biosynthetic protein FliR